MFLADSREAAEGRPAATGRDMGRFGAGRTGMALTTATGRAGGATGLPLPLLPLPLVGAGVGRASGGFIAITGVASVLPLPLFPLPLAGAGVDRGNGDFIAMAGGCKAGLGAAGGTAAPASGMPSFIC